MDSIARELDMQLQELLPAAAAWGLHLGSIERERFARFALELLRWNEQVNLTRITAPREVVIRHFLDSLSCVQAFETPPETLIDVGTGVFPGVPLKIVWPELALTLTDSTAKKTAFLDHVVDVLDLRDVTVVTARAETLGRDPQHRERYAAVVARAVAGLPVLSEYCLPLCRIGGRFVASKGSDGAAEAAAAEGAIAQLGGRLHAIVPIELPDVEPRTLVVIDKVSATPASLPRATGIPTKRPL